MLPTLICDGDYSPTRFRTENSDDNGTLWAAYRWKASSGGNSYRILESTDGGVTWSTSAGPVNLSTKFTITLTSLNGTKMLFMYARYTSSDLTYRVYDGTTWSSATNLAVGMPVNTVKQLSSATLNGTKQAYVAFLSGGNQGTLKVARFSGSGIFETIETADSTLTHWLPSTTVTYDDSIRIYTLYNNIIYETKKNSSGWQAPTAPYGTSFNSPDQLTTPTIGMINTGALWTEGAASPFTINYNGNLFTIKPSHGIIKCDFPVSLAQRCKDNGEGAFANTLETTPSEIEDGDEHDDDYDWHRCDYAGIEHNCVTTDFDTGGYPFVVDVAFTWLVGIAFACSHVGPTPICTTLPPVSLWTDPDSSGAIDIIDIPTMEASVIWTLYVYHFGLIPNVKSIRMDLPQGYADTPPP